MNLQNILVIMGIALFVISMVRGCGGVMSGGCGMGSRGGDRDRQPYRHGSARAGDGRGSGQTVGVGHVDIPRLREGGTHAPFFALPSPNILEDSTGAWRAHSSSCSRPTSSPVPLLASVTPSVQSTRRPDGFKLTTVCR